VPLPNDEGFTAIAHVLPLKGSAVRARLAARAAAAVFVAQGEEPQKVKLDAISRLFGLTLEEQRLLAEIAHGAGVTEAASLLCISEATARTHVQHIFRKTGVSRQADLIQLIATLMPGARLPDKE
jgi:DNA-binding CsgD family transcriptional regulator